MAFAFPTKISGSSQALITTPVNLRGVTIGETGGAVAAVRLWDNASAASGTLVATVRLAANTSQTVMFPGDGIRCVKGLYVEVVAGAVEGSVFT